MKILVKLGGTLLEDEKTREQLAGQLARLATAHQVTVVHGGGKQVTGYLEQQGIQSRFIGGLRVSDEAVIDAVTKIIAGSVNKQLVASLLREGASAFGLSGLDGLLTAATPLNPELGYVGRPGQTKGELLDLLITAGYLPVVACLAGDANGQTYNVNADQMAVSCALGWQATRLFFLTDVPGVKGSDGTLLRQLTATQSRTLIDDGVAQGGMQAKLEAALLALELGLPEVVVAAGREPDICGRLLDGATPGTRITLGGESL